MCEQFAQIASNLRFANFRPPKRDSQKKGVQFGNPETIRENQAIRANLQIDSREQGLFRTFRVLRYNQGSYQNLTVGMEGRSSQLCVLTFAYAGVTNVRFLGGHFGLEKKCLDPPPPPKSPIRHRHPPGPSAPPRDPPPPVLGFAIKNLHPPPSRRPRTPPSPSPSRKKIYIRNVHQVVVGTLIVMWNPDQGCTNHEVQTVN